MKFYRCDRKECGKVQSSPLQIELRGYYPNNAGGILLPEPLRLHQFCSHACFVQWIKWAMDHEEPAPANGM
jgi:hypothetical protein